MKVITFLPISKNEHRAAEVGVVPEQLYQDIYSWDDRKKIHRGFDFYYHLSRALFLLWPLYPVMLALRITCIGPFFYRIIARKRIQWFGTCRLPVDPHSVIPNPLIEQSCNGWRYNFFRPFLLVWVMFAGLYIAGLPHAPLDQARPTPLRPLFLSAHRLGIAPIDVFNHNDVGMSYHYFTVTQITPDKERLVDYTAPDGSRLGYHRSDRAYFGNSLLYRRMKNYEPLLPPTELDKRIFGEVMQWAERESGHPKAQYRFDFYVVKPPEEEGGLYHFFTPEKIDSITLQAP